MALAWRCCGLGTGIGTCMGMVDVDDGYAMVCGIFPGKSASVSGLLRDSVDPYRADFVGTQEMGLLDSMAVCEYRQSDAVPEGRTGVYADCQLPVSGQRRVVTVQLVQTL